MSTPFMKILIAGIIFVACILIGASKFPAINKKDI